MSNANSHSDVGSSIQYPKPADCAAEIEMCPSNPWPTVPFASAKGLAPEQLDLRELTGNENLTWLQKK